MNKRMKTEYLITNKLKEGSGIGKQIYLSVSKKKKNQQ